MTHTYKVLSTIDTAADKNPRSSYQDAVLSAGVQETFIKRISEKLNHKFSPNDPAFNFFYEETNLPNQPKLKQTELEVYSGFLPDSLKTKDGTPSFSPDLVADVYRQSLMENQIPLTPGFEISHDLKGKVLRQEGINIPDFAGYKVIPPHQSQQSVPSWEEMGVKNPISWEEFKQKKRGLSVDEPAAKPFQPKGPQPSF